MECLLLLVLMAATIPQEDGAVSREQVDLIERNNYYDCEGKPVFVQWILWDWDRGRHHVVAWRIDKPEFSFNERQLTLTWSDGGRLFQIRGRYWRETWEQHDPEVAERDILDRRYRRGIFGTRE